MVHGLAHDFQRQRFGGQRREAVRMAALAVKPCCQAADFSAAKFRSVPNHSRETKINVAAGHLKAEDVTAGAEKMVGMHFSRRMQHRGGGPAFANPGAVSFPIAALQQDGKIRMLMRVPTDSRPRREDGFGKTQVADVPLLYHCAVKPLDFCHRRSGAYFLLPHSPWQWTLRIDGREP